MAIAPRSISISSRRLDLAEPARALDDAARALGASVEARSTYPEFRRVLVTRGAETCVVDLVIDRAPVIDVTKASFGAVRVDTEREIAANKICTLLSRSELKDLVDLAALLHRGIELDQAFADARRKDAGAEPATLAWLLEQIAVGPEARLPGEIRPEDLLAFRYELVKKLRGMAFAEARHEE